MNPVIFEFMHSKAALLACAAFGVNVSAIGENLSEATSTIVSEQAAETISNLSGEEVDPSVLEEYFSNLPKAFVGWIFKVAIALVFLFVFWKIIGAIVRAIDKSMRRAGVDEGMINFISKLINVGLKILLIFIIAAQLGFNTASIVALLGSAGVAIGLAVQGTLSNLAGGVMILLTKPFKIGDYIIEDSHGHEGTVKEISLFTTKLTTADNRIIILPNGDLANTSLTNSTGNSERLLETKIGVAYKTDFEKARKALLKVMEDSEYILHDRDIKVVVSDFNDSSITLAMRGYVKSFEYLSAKWDINEKAKIALDNAGVEIPFPQVDVHISENSSLQMGK